MVNCFFNKILNGNTLKQRIIAKNPRVTIVAVPQAISFQKIKRKRGEKTAAQAQIYILSLTVSEVVVKS